MEDGLSAPTNCVACGQTGHNPTRFSFEDPKNDARYDIVKCDDCGFEWASPTPTPEELMAHYQASEDDYAGYVRSRELKKAHFQRHFDYIEKHRRPGRLLDVGCAAGFALEVGQERGWDVRGLELNPGFEPWLDPAVRDRVRFGHLHTLNDDPFDVITLFDVLEHAPDPSATLQAARERLVDGGLLALQLPCIDSLGARMLGSRWYHYAPPSHLSFFSLSSLERLASRIGFEPIFESWNAKLFTVRYLAAQVRHAWFPGLPATGIAQSRVGDLRLRVPMSERIILMRRT